MALRNLPSLFRSEKSNPLFSFQDDMRDLINRFDEWAGITESDLEATRRFVPKVDVQDRGDSYLVVAEIPGMTEDDISITLDQNVLILEGEKRSESEEKKKGYWRQEISYGNFYRTIPFNDHVDEAKVEASYKNGTLKVTLGKKEGTKAKGKKIEISTKGHVQ